MEFQIRGILQDVQIVINGITYDFLRDGKVVELGKIELQLLCDELITRDYPDYNIALRQSFGGIKLSLANAVQIVDKKLQRNVDITGIASGTFDINFHFESEKEDNLYRQALKGTIADCDKYIQSFMTKSVVYNKDGSVNKALSDKMRSSGRYTQQVLAIKRRLLKQKTESEIILSGNPSLMQVTTFVNEFPEDKNIKEIKGILNQLLEKKLFEICLSGTIDDCEEYEKTYPEGDYKVGVIARKNDLIRDEMYEDALNGGIEECKGFLDLYKIEDEYKANIKKRYDIMNKSKLDKIEKTIFDIAKTGTEEDCIKYITLYPEGKYIDEINRKLEEIEAENEIIEESIKEVEKYQQAMAGTIDDCEEYIKSYPEGDYLDIVQSHLNELQAAEAELSKFDEKQKDK